MWQPSERYPDPSIEILDDRFLKYRVFNANVERLDNSCRWSEGPVWIGDMRALIWSDIPNNRMMKYEESSNQVSVYRHPSNNANGNTRDRLGRLISCEHAGRRVVRTEHNGAITVLAESYSRKPLNSPNDVVVKSDGSIWFTDPTFGILGYYEGNKAEPQLASQVYRIDGQSGEIAVVCTDIVQPNGLCFTPDEKQIYIVESGSLPKRIWKFEVSSDGRQLSNKQIFHTCESVNHSPDGFRCDKDANLWAGWGTGDGRDGVRIFAPDGKAIGHIHLPERCANLCFGGPQNNRLYMAASHSLYALYVNTQGATNC
jgi:gluconolactonase